MTESQLDRSLLPRRELLDEVVIDVCGSRYHIKWTDMAIKIDHHFSERHFGAWRATTPFFQGTDWTAKCTKLLLKTSMNAPAFIGFTAWYGRPTPEASRAQNAQRAQHHFLIRHTFVAILCYMNRVVLSSLGVFLPFTVLLLVAPGFPNYVNWWETIMTIK